MSFDDFVISFSQQEHVSNISIYIYSMSKRINPTINALSSHCGVVTTVLIIANVIRLLNQNAHRHKLLKEEQIFFCSIFSRTLALVIF